MKRKEINIETKAPVGVCSFRGLNFLTESSREETPSFTDGRWRRGRVGVTGGV